MPGVRCPKCKAINALATTDGSCRECRTPLPLDPTQPKASPLSVFKRGSPNEEQWSAEEYWAAQQVAFILFFLAVAGSLVGVGSRVFAPLVGGGEAESSTAFVTAVALAAGVVIVFLGLAAWALFKPVVAGTIGAVCYIGLNILYWKLGDEDAPKGFVVTVLVLFFLIRAIRASVRARDARMTS